jgi:hypothetical protein
LCLLRDAAWYAQLHAHASNFYDSELSSICGESERALATQQIEARAFSTFWLGQPPLRAFLMSHAEKFASELPAMHN